MVSIEKLKQYKKLRDKKYRDQSGLIIVEGPNSTSAIKKYFPNSIVEQINEENELERVSKDSGGIVVIAKKDEIRFKEKEVGPIVVCKEITDPGNAGTVIRAGAAFGAKQIVFSQNSVDKWNPKVIRSSVGTVFQIDVLENKKFEDILYQYKLENKLLIGADIIGTKRVEPKSLYSKEIENILKDTDDIVFVFGNEARGMSDEDKKLLDEIVFIPIDSSVESLNLAASVNIFLSELLRVRG